MGEGYITRYCDKKRKIREPWRNSLLSTIQDRPAQARHSQGGEGPGINTDSWGAKTEVQTYERLHSLLGQAEVGLQTKHFRIEPPKLGGGGNARRLGLTKSHLGQSAGVGVVMGVLRLKKQQQGERRKRRAKLCRANSKSDHGPFELIGRVERLKEKRWGAMRGRGLSTTLSFFHVGGKSPQNAKF